MPSMDSGESVFCYTIGTRCLVRRFVTRWAATGVETVRLPPHAPNLNAYAERFVRTIKESSLNRMLLFGERSLRRAIAEFVSHYHLRTQSPGSRQPTAHLRRDNPTTRGAGRVPGTTRRSAEVLPPACRIDPRATGCLAPVRAVCQRGSRSSTLTHSRAPG